MNAIDQGVTRRKPVDVEREKRLAALGDTLAGVPLVSLTVFLLKAWVAFLVSGFLVWLVVGVWWLLFGGVLGALV